VGGTLAIFLIERSGSFSDPGLLRDFGQAFFQSATCRTAGFNTMDLTTMGPASLIVMMVLMAIGAAPGSTAGGLKLTTVAVLWANLRAIVAGDDQARLFDREIPRLVVRRSFMILTSWILALILAVLLLLISGAGPLESVLFESVSALGTVGLSLGLTPDLSILGKVTVILLMFLGRLGPLAVAYGLVATSQSSTVRYPETTLMVG
jgi:trk system potassium uptake protein TrkH